MIHYDIISILLTIRDTMNACLTLLTGDEKTLNIN